MSTIGCKIPGEKSPRLKVCTSMCVCVCICACVIASKWGCKTRIRHSTEYVLPDLPNGVWFAIKIVKYQIKVSRPFFFFFFFFFGGGGGFSTNWYYTWSCATGRVAKSALCSGVARIFLVGGGTGGPWIFVGAHILSWAPPPPQVLTFRWNKLTRTKKKSSLLSGVGVDLGGTAIYKGIKTVK